MGMHTVTRTNKKARTKVYTPTQEHGSESGVASYRSEMKAYK